MDIPELLLLMADSLDHSSLVSALRVNKFWNRVLTPRLYREILNFGSVPPVHLLVRHCLIIRSLKLSSQTYASLSLYSNPPVQCSRLRELDLNIYNLCEYRPWGAIFEYCSRTDLQELSLCTVSLSNQETDILLERLGPVLIRLDLLDCPITWTGMFPSSPGFPKLTHLSIRDSLGTVVKELKWIQQCPRLKGLDWQGIHVRPDLKVVFLDDLCTHSRQWPTTLQSIELYSVSELLGDQLIALILKSCRSGLRELVLGTSEFFLLSLYELERHFPTLERIEVSQCHRVRPWMNQWILSSCPKLLRFGGILNAHELISGYDTKRAWSKFMPKNTKVATPNIAISRDCVSGIPNEAGERKVTIPQEVELDQITEETEMGQLREVSFEKLKSRFIAMLKDRVGAPRPWVCLNLRELSAPILFDKHTRPEWDDQILQQLSKLTSLQVLDLSVSEDNAVEGTIRLGPLLTLQTGLAHLATLKKLREVNFSGTETDLKMADFEFMLEQWPLLKNLTTGHLSISRSMASNMAAEKGIQLVVEIAY
ncbi:hypothetical protein BGZ83_005643 [Gryganskiella cystojenkinii]|nr:hypothetical protein BGZ83_005643 [Gryganskiella cystojenkinii]